MKNAGLSRSKFKRRILHMNSIASAVQYFLDVLHVIFQISIHTSKGWCIFSRNDFDNREEFDLLMIHVYRY